MNYGKKAVKKKRNKMGKKIIIIKKISSTRKISIYIEQYFTHIQLIIQKQLQILSSVQASCITIKFYTLKISSRMMMATVHQQVLVMLMVDLIIKN